MKGKSFTTLFVFYGLLMMCFKAKKGLLVKYEINKIRFLSLLLPGLLAPRPEIPECLKLFFINYFLVPILGNMQKTQCLQIVIFKSIVGEKVLEACCFNPRTGLGSETMDLSNLKSVDPFQSRVIIYTKLLQVERFKSIIAERLTA